MTDRTQLAALIREHGIERIVNAIVGIDVPLVFVLGNDLRGWSCHWTNDSSACAFWRHDGPPDVDPIEAVLYIHGPQHPIWQEIADDTAWPTELVTYG